MSKGFRNQERQCEVQGQPGGGLGGSTNAGFSHKWADGGKRSLFRVNLSNERQQRQGGKCHI